MSDSWEGNRMSGRKYWQPTAGYMTGISCELTTTITLYHHIGMLTPVSSVQSLSTQRSATNGDYIVPRTHRKLGERAFSVAAPKAWNRLPTKLKTSTCSTDSFKPFLFQSAYGCETRVG